MSAQGGPIKVIFLTFYYEAWDALAGIYELMRADSRFDVTVVAISRKLTGEAGFDDAAGVSAFFERLGIPHLVNADLAGIFDGSAPDYIFVNYPWQRNYEKRYRPDALAAIGRIVYVPYFSLPLVQEPADGVNPDTGFQPIAAHLYTQRMHQLASLVFTQDDFTRDAFALTQRGNTHVHFVGSTKLDELVADYKVAKDAVAGVGKTLLWAPHHSYSPHWLNFGNFAQVKEDMLAWAGAHADWKIILRPHPFLFGTLIDRRVLPAAELESWLQWWNALPNTQIDVSSSSADIFAKSSHILTDGISYLAEWPLATGKSPIFLEHEGHWDFSPLGELAAATSHKISMIGELDAATAMIDIDANRMIEIAELHAAALPNPGRTAHRIVEVVAADYESGSSLVDASLITEVPWELQANREPLD
jgi:hypothetical protein